MIDGRALADRNRSGAVIEHERVVRSVLEAFNRRDIAGVLDLLHPLVTIRTVSAVVLGDGRPYTGHEGIRRYFVDLERHWLELTVEPIHVRGAGDAVVALGVAKGRGRTPEFILRDVPTSWFIRFREDQVFELRIFFDKRAYEEVLAKALASQLEAIEVLGEPHDTAPGPGASQVLDDAIADLAGRSPDSAGGVQASPREASRLARGAGSAG
jgi:ketosteroid isomerase-like protein